MEVSLANRVGDLLEQKTDEHIGWTGPDDGGFTKSVMRGVNGIHPSVSLIDSKHWISECNKPIPSVFAIHNFTARRIYTQSTAVYHYKSSIVYPQTNK